VNNDRLDGGSAAPAAPDVPTCGDQLAVEPDNWTYVCSNAAGHDGPHFDSRRPISWTHLLDHSGVAGEPEATTKEAPEIDSEPSPTQVPVPDPVDPAASNLGGGTLVSDETVEALARHLSEETLPVSWRTDDRWARCRSGVIEAWGPKARAYLAVAAPLIAAQALRSYADREHPGPEPVIRQTNYGTGVEYDTDCAGCGSWWSDDEGGCTERVALIARADELERGTGHVDG